MSDCWSKLDYSFLATEVMGWRLTKLGKYETTAGATVTSMSMFDPGLNYNEAISLLASVKSKGGAYNIASCEEGVEVLVSFRGKVGKGFNSIDLNLPLAICDALLDAIRQCRI